VNSDTCFTSSKSWITVKTSVRFAGAYQEMAMHYGIGVVPARPYKPRDKAKVESSVQLVKRCTKA
jgi:transposase